mgnify:CR=1 FL=1
MIAEREIPESQGGGGLAHQQSQSHGRVSVIANEGKVLVIIMVPQGRIALRRVSKGNMEGQT